MAGLLLSGRSAEVAACALETALRHYRRNGRAPNEEMRQLALALVTAVPLVAAALPGRPGVPDRGPRLNGFHVTRHTFASACLSDGLNPAKVAALLGDTLEVTLDTYAHFLPDDDDRAREILRSFFRPADRPSAQNVPGGMR